MGTHDIFSLGPISGEFADSQLGDRRLSSRLLRIATGLGSKPEESLPKALVTEAELEGAYRFLSNPRVKLESILGPHVRETVRRSHQCTRVLLLHDTTSFLFSGEGDGERTGMGWLTSESQSGFFGHFTLAVSDESLPVALGVLEVNTYFSIGESQHKGGKGGNSTGKKESERWWDGVVKAERLLDNQVDVVHVMDREADDYRLFDRLHGNKSSFVIRLRRDRRVDVSTTDGRLRTRKFSDILGHAEHVYETTVQLAERKQSQFHKAKKIHPARQPRKARLAFSVMRVLLSRPINLKEGPENLELNVIRVHEIEAPAGQEPVEWILLTNLDVDTPQRLVDTVEIYRRRWIIEEYFKAIKTGCQFEKRQLESYQSLRNTLAITIPLAWQLLLLRSLSRVDESIDASAVLTPAQIKALKCLSVDRLKKRLPPQLSAKIAMLAIAKLGGHLKRNGPPGWQVLGRGYHDLITFTEGWRLAMEDRSRGCDQ